MKSLEFALAKMGILRSTLSYFKGANARVELNPIYKALLENTYNVSMSQKLCLAAIQNYP